MTTWYACGCDPSGGGAYQFAWGIGHWDADRIIMDLVEAMGGGRQRIDPQAAVRACAERCRTYRIGKVLGDRYAGDWPKAAFRDAGILYEQSPKDKAALYLETLPLWTAGRIEIPDDRTLVRQLKLLERTGAGRGRDRVDRPRGSDDGLANAVALCVAALGPAASGRSVWLHDPSIPVGPSRADGIQARTEKYEREAGTPIGVWWNRRR